MVQFLRLLSFTMFAVILFATGSLMYAQEVPGTLPSSETMKAANPPIPKYISRPGNRTTTADERKRLEFKQAIENGNAARDKSDYPTAFRSYLEASKLLSNDASSYYGLGNVYFDVYCYNSAIDFYSQATKLKPEYIDALMQLGFAYLNTEKYDEAEAQFEAVLKVNSKNISAKLGRFYVWAKKGKYKEAIDSVNNVINETSIGDKDRALAYMTLGEIYVAQRNWPEAIEPFQKATKLKPDLAVAFLRLGTSQLVTAIKSEPLPMELTIEAKERFTASVRQATDTLTTAVDMKHYEHPNQTTRAQ
jgi:tetratricopeptide (TPR) repeat protein